MTREQLLGYTKKELAALARQRGIAEWHAMRKGELVDALLARDRGTAPVPPARPQASAARNTAAPAERGGSGTVPRPTTSAPPRELPVGYGKDRIVALVRDPYWLHTYWEVTRPAQERAEAALGEEWYTARPGLRLVAISGADPSSFAEAVVRDIEIHGGSSNWYIDVPAPGRTYRVDIGYRSRTGRFYVLARSNLVTTPRATACDALDEEWAEPPRTAAPSGTPAPNENRLRRPVGVPSASPFGSGGFGLPSRERKFWFQFDAELIVYGATDPRAQVTLQGEAVRLRTDGTFTMRFALPDNRQIIPAVALSPDGAEERTIVLAVERNMRHLEPVLRGGEE